MFKTPYLQGRINPTILIVLEGSPYILSVAVAHRVTMEGNLAPTIEGGTTSFIKFPSNSRNPKFQSHHTNSIKFHKNSHVIKAFSLPDLKKPGFPKWFWVVFFCLPQQCHGPPRRSIRPWCGPLYYYGGEPRFDPSTCKQ